MARNFSETDNFGVLKINSELGRLVRVYLDDPKRPGNMKYGSFRAYVERLIAEDMAKKQALTSSSLSEILEQVKGDTDG